MDKTPVKVESYNDVAWTGSWRQRAAGMWAAGGLGLATGAAIGLVAPFFPVVVGALAFSQAASLVLTSVATFASLGIVAGATAGGIVGGTSGAAAAVAEETELRNKKREAALGLSDAELGAKESQHKAPEREGFFKKYVNVRSGLIFIGLGLIAGAVFAAAAIPAGLPGMAMALSGTGLGAVVSASTAGLSGAAATANAALATAAYTVGVMGCFGAMFGVRYASMTNDARKYTAAMLSTKFGDAKTPQPALEKDIQPSQMLLVANENTMTERVSAPVAHVADECNDKKHGHFGEMVTKRRLSSESEVALSS